jgi:hypothetical protein
MAVIAEGAFVACSTEPVIRGGIESMVFDKDLGVTERFECFESAFLLVFVAFGAIHLLT